MGSEYLCISLISDQFFWLLSFHIFVDGVRSWKLVVTWHLIWILWYKKNHQTILNFYYRKHFSKKIFSNWKIIFSKIEKFQKFSLEINIKNFKKVGKKSTTKKTIFFRLFLCENFWNFLYWFSMKCFEIFDFSKKNPKKKFGTFSKNVFHLKKKYIYSGIFFLMSKLLRNPKIIIIKPCEHYKIV